MNGGKHMRSTALTVNEYLNQLTEERKIIIERILEAIRRTLPDGFVELMRYGMIVYEVPHSVYPKGYHANPTVGLTHIGIADCKQSVSLYHMGIYAIPELLAWFREEYTKFSSKRLDMGKSCIRFKKEADIPFDLISELSKKLTVQDVITLYESSRKKEKVNE